MQLRLMLSTTTLVVAFISAALQGASAAIQNTIYYEEDSCGTAKGAAMEEIDSCNPEDCEDGAAVTCSQRYGPGATNAFGEEAFILAKTYQNEDCSGDVTSAIAYIADGNCSKTGASTSADATINDNGWVILSMYGSTDCSGGLQSGMSTSVANLGCNYYTKYSLGDSGTDTDNDAAESASGSESASESSADSETPSGSDTESDSGSNIKTPSPSKSGSKSGTKSGTKSGASVSTIASAAVSVVLAMGAVMIVGMQA